MTDKSWKAFYGFYTPVPGGKICLIDIPARPHDRGACVHAKTRVCGLTYSVSFCRCWMQMICWTGKKAFLKKPDSISGNDQDPYLKSWNLYGRPDIADTLPEKRRSFQGTAVLKEPFIFEIVCDNFLYTIILTIIVFGG